jgi:autotransporter-associated beta strand protein
MSTSSKLIAITALAAGLLAAPGAALAAITIQDSFVNYGIGYNTGGTANAGGDGAINYTTTSNFTVTPGANELVVQFDESLQNGDTSGINVTWDGMALTCASSIQSANNSFLISQIWYLKNPPAASSAFTITGTGRTFSLGAFSLTGVNSAIAPVGYAKDTTTGKSSAVTTAASTPMGSFAAVAEGLRTAANTNTAFFLGASGGAPTQQWTVIDSGPDNGTFQYGGGVVSNLPFGATTITQSNSNSSGNRNEIAVAVFTSAGGPSWNLSGNGSWNSPGSWGSAAVPTGTGAVAEFLATAPTTTATVTLDAAITLNALLISNSNQINITPGSGGSLTLAPSGSILPSIAVGPGSVSISAPVSLNASTTIGISSGQTLNISGNIVDGTASSGISVPAGSGTLILGGVNTYSGTTNVAGGFVNVTGSLGNTPIILSGGTLNVAGTLPATNPITISGGAANLTVNGTNAISLSGGALTLSGSLANSPQISVTGGTLALQSSGEISQNTLAISGGTGAIALLTESASNAITGTTALSISGNALAILSQANNYSGLTTVKGGTLDVAMPGSLYAGNTASWTPGNITVSNGGTLAALLAVHYGGPNDFTQPQAALLLANLSASTSSSGLGAGTSFGLDTTNAAGAVTYGGQIADTTAGSLGFVKKGSGILVLSNTNSYSGPTVAVNGELILNGPNTAGTVAGLSASNTIVAGTTILSIRNAAALGSGTANSSLAPITLNATGGTLSASILEIGDKIGTDPGQFNADFSYQVVANGNNATGTSVPTNVVAGPGQINLGFLGNSNDGTGFAAWTPTTTSPPRIVALYSASAANTLAIIGEKTQFGQGSGDHLAFGSPTANNTLVLENSIDFAGGPQRRWATIRGVGIVPEGNLVGTIINSAGGSNNVSFDGNGGLVFDNGATSYTAASLQINGGAVYIAANDPAQAGLNGALGSGTAAIQVGTSTTINPSGGTPVPTAPTANVAFMTFGPNAGVGSIGVITSRPINVGGSDVTYANATLGGMTFDWTEMNGAISLNEPPATPTTFTARNGGRVDFGGTISGSGSVVVGNSTVEGDATSPGIAVNNNGTIVFNGQANYTGSTTVSAGKLYVNNTMLGSSVVTVGSGATLGGEGMILSPVNVLSGGILEGGQSGIGALTLGSSVTLNGPTSVNFGALSTVGNPSLVISSPGALNTNGNPVTLNILAISQTGNYALIGYSGIQSASSAYTLGVLPARAIGTLAFNNGANELDLDVTSVTILAWTGTASSSWDTTTTNWAITGGGGSTQYIDNPGDIVTFDDSAAPHTTVTINGADVHPSSVTFNNNNTTYTISGSNAIAGGTGLQLAGTGTVILLNANTFTGATSIGAGATLQLGNGAAGNDGSISQSLGISNSGALVYKLSGAQTYGGVISGTGPLTLQSGKLTLTGSDTYSGTTTISGGTLQMGAGVVNRDGSLASNVTNNGALIFNYFGGQTYAGTLSGPGALTKNGAGSLTLTASNNFTGGTQLIQGTLQLANQDAIQSSLLTIGQFGSLTFAGGVGVFDIAGLAGSGGINLTDSSPAAVALTISNSGPNTVFSGTISGSGSITQAGPNSLTLSGTSGYSGGTTIGGGTLAITNANSLGAIGGAVNVGAATLEVAGNIADARTINLNDPASVIRVDASQSYNNTGMLSGGNLTKTGPGTLILAGTYNTSPTTAVNGGTLLASGSFVTLGTVAVAPSSVFGGNASAGDTTVQNRGTIDVSANSGGNGSTLSLTGLTLGQTLTDTGTMNFSAGHPAVPELAIGFDGLTANGGNNSVTVNVNAFGALTGTYTLATYSGVIGGTGSSAFVLGPQSGLTTRESGALVVTGSSINYVLTGNYPVWQGTKGSLWTAGSNWVLNNTVTQTTFVAGDTVVFDDTAGTTVGGTTTVSISGANVSPSSVTFNNNAFNYTISGTNGIAGSGYLTVGGTGKVTLSTSNSYSGGTIVNAGTLIVANTNGIGTGTGAVNINGGLLIANNSGGTAISSPININSGGTLQLGNGNALGTLGVVPLDNGVFAFSRSDSVTYAGVINGTGALVQHGPGLLTPTSTTSTYAGGTTVNGGTLAISTDANLGAVPGTSQPANITLNGGVLQIKQGTVGTPNLYTINANRGITVGPAGGTINIGFVNTTQTFQTETGVFLGSAITGSGGFTLTGSGGWNATNQSILNLQGINSTYSGNTTVNNAVLAYSDSNGPYNSLLPPTTVLNLVNSGCFNIDASTSTQTVAGLTGDPTGLVGTCNGSATVGLIINSNGNYTYSGLISPFTYVAKVGAAARFTLTMSGSGSETLTGSNTYAGGTTVNGGTLVLGNNSAIGVGGLTANGGVTDLHGFNPTVSSFSGSAGLVTNNGAADSLLTDNQGAAATTFGGTISNGPTNKVALNLTTAGTGELTLTGANTYSGSTTINGGSTLQLGNSGNSGSIGNSAVTDNGSLIVSRSDSVNLTSLISGSLGGTGNLTLNGGGTLTLTGTNTYSGGTIVEGGTMIATNPAAIEDGTNLTVGNVSAFPAPVVPAPVAGSTAAAVPEPGTLALFAAVTALTIGIWRRKVSHGTQLNG